MRDAVECISLYLCAEGMSQKIYYSLTRSHTRVVSMSVLCHKEDLRIPHNTFIHSIHSSSILVSRPICTSSMDTQSAKATGETWRQIASILCYPSQSGSGIFYHVPHITHTSLLWRLGGLSPQNSWRQCLHSGGDSASLRLLPTSFLRPWRRRLRCRGEYRLIPRSVFSCSSGIARLLERKIRGTQKMCGSMRKGQVSHEFWHRQYAWMPSEMMKKCGC